MPDRKAELMTCFEDIDENEKLVIINLIDEVVYLETQLTELKKLPSIVINPNNPSQQKVTPAGRMYKELLQQYNSVIKNLHGYLHKVEHVADSPLRAYFKEIMNE